MQDKRYRIKLPLIFGAIALVLIAWDLYNASVIARMRDAWSINAPMWPYQAPEHLMVSLFVPAYLLAELLSWGRKLDLSIERYAFVFPCVLAFWWWIGLRFDNGILPTKRWRFRWLFAVIFQCAGIAMGLYWLILILDQIKWWLGPFAWNCGLDRIIVTAVRDTMLTAWMLGLAAWAFVAGKRLIKLGNS